MLCLAHNIKRCGDGRTNGCLKEEVESIMALVPFRLKADPELFF